MVVKIFAAILSLFFLMLSVLPCSDEPSAENEKCEQLVVNQCDAPESGDLCSPFCHCQCCSMHFIDFELLSFNLLNPEAPGARFGHFDDQEQEVQQSLLQPPRV